MEQPIDKDVELAKASSHANDGTAPDAAGPVKKRIHPVWWLLGGIVLIAGIVLAITIPLVNNNNNNEEEAPPEIRPGPVNVTVNGAEFVSFEGTFNATLRLFDERVLLGYNSPEEFQHDLGDAARFLLNGVVLRNIGEPGYENAGFGGERGVVGGVNDEFVNSPGMDMNNPEAASTPDAPKVDSQIDDYGTNNQEDNVEQGDLTVSDGTFVYAIYGKYIVIWRADTGKHVLDVDIGETAGMGGTDGSKGSTDGSTGEVPVVSFPRDGSIGELNLAAMVAPGFFGPSVWLRKLLLSGNRLILITSGHGYDHRRDLDYGYPILSGYMDTRVSVYDVDGLNDGIKPSLNLIAQEDINGNFADIREVDGQVHVVTTSSIDTYSTLSAPIERNYVSPQGSHDEYVSQARKIADENAIPQFVDRLTAELAADGVFPDLVRISLGQAQTSGTDLEQMQYQDGVLNAISTVHSFAVANANEQGLGRAVSGVFSTSSWVQVYASRTDLLVASQTWGFDSASGTSSQSTNFVGLGIRTGKASPNVLGSVNGHILNSYSIDIVDEDSSANSIIRIASTVQQSWRIGIPEIMEFSDTDGVRQEPTLTQDSSTKNYITTFRRVDDTTSENTTTLIQLDQIVLGKPNEVFQAVKFLDERAFAVTFERTDPFYIIDMSDPEDLTILGLIDDITGFSAYLDVIDDFHLLGIGQEADRDGRVVGLALTVYDMTNETHPVIAAKEVLEQDPNAYSSSDALWSFEAIRFTTIDREANQHILSIPVNVYDWRNPANNFNGFYIYDITPRSISRRCTVTHGTNQMDGEVCYYCGSLVPRSMIFGGDLMTMGNHFVRSTDLNSCQWMPGATNPPGLVWELDITIETNACCNYFY